MLTQQHHLSGHSSLVQPVLEKNMYTEIIKVINRKEKPQFTPNTITTIGIPTRDRPELLSRSVNSFLTNTLNHGRETTFTVVDDSRETAMQTKNREILSDISANFGRNIYYAGIKERRNYCKLLSDYVGLPPDIIEFAFLGDDRCDYSYGSNRNTLLVHSVGEVCLQTDDDTICKIAPSPNIDRGLALSSANHLNEFWFYASRSAAFGSVTPIEKDLLSIHEKLLGKPVCDAIKLNIDDGINAAQPLLMNDINSDFIENMQLPDAKIAVTYVGSVGDSGLRKNYNAARLFLKNGNFERLIRSKHEYSMNINTRNIVRTARYNTINKSNLFINMCTGLDNRNLLPPFMPVQRKDDGIFGRVLRLCFPQAFSGFLPYVIYHDPPEDRSEAKQEPFKSLKYFRMNDILDILISFYQSRLTCPNSAKNITILGQLLEELSIQPSAEFKEFILTKLYESISIKIKIAKCTLDENSGDPIYWRQDMNRCLSILLETLLMKDICILSDLHGDEDKKLSLFQEMVGKYGSLLTCWPDIINGAKELRNKENTLTTIL